jgi:hypothetical protein
MALVFLFVSMGVHGKPRMYYSLLAYCNARFGRSNFGHQMPPAPTDAFRTLAAEVGTYGRGMALVLQKMHFLSIICYNNNKAHRSF